MAHQNLIRLPALHSLCGLLRTPWPAHSHFPAPARPPPPALSSQGLHAIPCAGAFSPG